jgi:hypothetical protein
MSGFAENKFPMNGELYRLDGQKWRFWSARILFLINDRPVADSGMQLPIPLIFNLHIYSEMANCPKNVRFS